MFPNYRGILNFPNSNQGNNNFNYPSNMPNNFNISNMQKQNMNNFYMDPLNTQKGFFIYFSRHNLFFSLYIDIYPQSKPMMGKAMNPNLNFNHEANLNNMNSMTNMNIMNPQPTKTLKSNSTVFIPSSLLLFNF